jgi:hypothetical protein
LDQIMNFVTSDGWVVELFVDVWTVAEWEGAGHMDHHLQRDKHFM